MSTEKKTPEMMQSAEISAQNQTGEKEAENKADKDNDEKEIGGFKDAGLPEPTRFGDWEVKGRCSDF